MNIVPSKRTIAIARRMATEATESGADVVLAYYADVQPDQIPALVGILAKWAAGKAVINVDVPGTWSTDPAWVCAEAMVRAARHYGIDAIGTRHNRAEHYTRARAVAMSAARHAGVSYAEIGRQYEKDHTTIMSADRKVQRNPEWWAVAVRIGDDLRGPLRVVA